MTILNSSWFKTRTWWRNAFLRAWSGMHCNNIREREEGGSIELSDPFESFVREIGNECCCSPWYWYHTIQTDSETFILSPDLSAAASPDLKLYIGANIFTLQACWYRGFPPFLAWVNPLLLGILHNFILPKENNLPTTYDEAVAKLKPFLTPVKDYHCYINDCIIIWFRGCGAGNYGKLERRPHCSEECYLSGSKIQRKWFKYLSLEKRFRRFLQQLNYYRTTAQNFFNIRTML